VSCWDFFAYNLEKSDIWQPTVALMVLPTLKAMGPLPAFPVPRSKKRGYGGRRIRAKSTT
jgi:hypothetical protein